MHPLSSQIQLRNLARFSHLVQFRLLLWEEVASSLLLSLCVHQLTLGVVSLAENVAFLESGEHVT